MATQLEIKNAIIRDIASEFFDKIPFYYIDTSTQISSVEDFRKIISGGGISTTSGQQNQLVLYRQDYQVQTPPTNFDTLIDNLTQCYCTTDVQINSNGTFGHSCGTYGTEYIGNLTFTFDGDGSVGTPYINFTIETDANGGCFGDVTVTIDNSVLSILSQYIPFDYTQINIDPTQAQQVLDTNIFELIPQQTLRQQQIDKFFTDYGNLKGDAPVFTMDEDGFFVTEDPNYDLNHDISNTNLNGFIPRLEIDDSENPNDTQNLEWLRNDLNIFLRDIDQEGVEDLDDRPEYENKSDGYLKIRHMNQAIIVRKEEGTDVGLMKNVINDTCLDPGGPSYLCDGFTITMWVKFLDKVNTGTLFNFGNPLRENNPMGFMLETFVVNKDEYDSPPSEYFTEGDTERFIRLVVHDGTNIRDSHIGAVAEQNRPRLDTTVESTGLPALEHDSIYAFNYTRVPIDLNEWYFIVANYNPNILEEQFNVYENNPDYWKWNYYEDSYRSNSGYGAKCKVELISKSDLIRARGFKSSD
tara:strand:- start:1367 stop:2941 length:1575 start_codon:yes stop_codon:yes gene_type:complete